MNPISKIYRRRIGIEAENKASLGKYWYLEEYASPWMRRRMGSLPIPEHPQPGGGFCRFHLREEKQGPARNDAVSSSG